MSSIYLKILHTKDTKEEKDTKKEERRGFCPKAICVNSTIK